MRFGAAISLLCAVASMTPLAFAAPVAADSTVGFEARGFDAEAADLVARSNFDEATSLLARAVADVLSARTDRPGHQNPVKPKNDKKRMYEGKKPVPIPKTSLPKFKPKGTPDQSAQPKQGSSRPRALEEVDGLWQREFDDELWARTEPPPHYQKHDPINGKKPKYIPKVVKYRQNDESLRTPSDRDRRVGGAQQRPAAQSQGQSRPRDLEEVDGLWQREFDDELWARTEPPPHYQKHDPLNGKKPKYIPKVAKYRQNDASTREPTDRRARWAEQRVAAQSQGQSRPRDLEEVDGLWQREFNDELWSREFYD
ncbi:hypothetical protein EVJ58_g7593 [Rhodofomes roseus]|uniref:Uncharacterized protein n=1 Tax=Rhodofomes roseus TaxID=34475 RepID=A0A4Y9Y230_9APHY|nr:hypothetical protein EVJ58_g7593 [Rhodofomes roseus]